MAEYRYLVADSSTGYAKAEVPFTGVRFSRQLSGCGEFTATLPDDWQPILPNGVALDVVDIFGLGTTNTDREITVLRDDLPVWNGPITGLDTTQNPMTVTARESSWYFGHRTLESKKTYTAADVFDIWRDVFTSMTTKTASGSDGLSAGATINAALPRFTINPASALAGQTGSFSYFGSARHVIADILDEISADPTVGFEYRMDYASSSSRQLCQRTMVLGCPSVGVTLPQLLTQHVLKAPFGPVADWERGAIRVHVVGSGYTKTLQNTGATTGGTILTEAVFNRTDSSNHGGIDSLAKEARRKTQPPVRTYLASYSPGSALPYGWCDLGDKVTMAITWPPVKVLSGSRRVMEITTTPQSGGGVEDVTLSLNLPLDQLGA